MDMPNTYASNIERKPYCSSLGKGKLYISLLVFFKLWAINGSSINNSPEYVFCFSLPSLSASENSCNIHQKMLGIVNWKGNSGMEQSFARLSRWDAGKICTLLIKTHSLKHCSIHHLVNNLHYGEVEVQRSTFSKKILMQAFFQSFYSQKMEFFLHSTLLSC